MKLDKDRNERDNRRHILCGRCCAVQQICRYMYTKSNSVGFQKVLHSQKVITQKCKICYDMCNKLSGGYPCRQ